MPFSSELNPYAAPQVASEAVLVPKPHRRPVWLRRWVILQFLVLACALGAQFYSVESIVISGPIFAIVGLVVVIVALRHRDLAAIVVGGSAALVAVLIFCLIYFNHWSPREAERPVLITSWIYAIAILPIAFRILFAAHPQDSVSTLEPELSHAEIEEVLTSQSHSAGSLN